MKVELVKLVLFFKSQSQILVGEVFIKNYENIWEFLAVQNSSIGDLVPWLVLQSCLATAKKPKIVPMCAGQNLDNHNHYGNTKQCMRGKVQSPSRRPQTRARARGCTQG